MNHRLPTHAHSLRQRSALLNADEHSRLDAVLDEFERQCREQTELPNLEDYLEGEGTFRDELFAELLAIELHWQQRSGQTLNLAKLKERFPAEAEQIDDLFARLSSQTTATEKVEEFSPTFPARFMTVSEIARGGMGSVWRVMDLQFNRPLAVKVMLPKHAVVPAAVARFEREAQLTGSLQHPAIPPVVDRGQLADGAPYFSMKLIEGETLSKLLERRAADDSQLSHWIGIFEQICQAVAYAHSLGVIHRDLKPANVMVGAFGEVQVMDWGMAKRLDEAGQEVPGPQTDGLSSPIPQVAGKTWEETKVLVDGQDGTDLTRDGTIMGTLAYMPPEQARGEVHRLDCRSDVFSLGAILAEILTGEKLYVGDNALRRAATADLQSTFNTLDATTDTELGALCKRCLSVDQNARPKDAAAVAVEIRRWDETAKEKLEQERADRAAADARAEVERSRRRVAMALFAAVLLIVIGSSSAAWWYMSDQAAKAAVAQRNSEAADAEIGMLLDRSLELRQDFDFQTAESLLKQASSRTAALLIPDTRQQEIAMAVKDLEMIRKLDDIRLRSVSTDPGFDDSFLTGKDGEYAAAFRNYGIDVLSVEESLLGEYLFRSLERAKLQDPTGLAAADAIRSSTISKELLAALDSWATHDVANRRRIQAIAREATDDPQLKKLRDPFLNVDAEFASAVAEIEKLSPATLDLIAARLQEVDKKPSLRYIRTRAAMNGPQDFWAQFNAGAASSKEDSKAYYRVAISLRPEIMVSYFNLANLVKSSCRIEAENVLRKAVAAAPNNVAAQLRLAELLDENDVFIKTECSQPPYQWAENGGGGGSAGESLGIEYSINLQYTIKGVSSAEQFARAGVIAKERFAKNPKNKVITVTGWQLFEHDDRLGDAEAAFQKALALEPDHAEAHCKYGLFLMNRHQNYQAAVDHLTKGHELGSRQRGWGFPSADWLADAKQKLAWNQAIKAYQTDKSVPEATSEKAALARFALYDIRKPQLAAELYDLAIVDVRVEEDSSPTSNTNDESSTGVDDSSSTSQEVVPYLMESAGALIRWAEESGIDSGKRRELRDVAIERLTEATAFLRSHLAAENEETRKRAKSQVYQLFKEPSLYPLSEFRTYRLKADPKERKVWDDFWSQAKVLQTAARKIR